MHVFLVLAFFFFFGFFPASTFLAVRLDVTVDPAAIMIGRSVFVWFFAFVNLSLYGFDAV